MAALLLPAAAVANPWYWHYQEAQRHLVAGRWAEAEHELLEAIAARPESGCHLRTYGIKYRDYVPYYYLGVVQQEQGRAEEARASLARAVSDGSVDSCGGTRVQALDLRERLTRLGAPVPSGGASVPPAPRSEDLAALRAEALAAGAESLAGDQLAAADRALARAARGDSAAADEAATALVQAISRARTQAPILALLRREADEAVGQARLLAARVPEASSDRSAKSAREALQQAESELPSAATVEAFIEVTSLADAAVRGFGAAQLAAVDAERAARERDAAELAISLADAARDRVPMAGRRVPAFGDAVREVDEARRALAGNAGPARAFALAQRARESFAQLAHVEVGPLRDGSGPDAREVWDLAWSASTGGAPALVSARSRAAAGGGSRP